MTRAPYQGGLWEAVVQSAKSSLLRATKGITFTYEEISTICAKIKTILNSRSISYRFVW